MGSTDSFLPGSWKAAPAVGEFETAAAEPEAAPAEGVPADPAEDVGVVGVGTGVVVTESATAEVVPDGTGTEETPITTIGGDPDTEGERVDADADADVLTDTDTDDTSMADEVGLAEAEVVTEEDAVEEVKVVDTVEEAVDAEEVADDAEGVVDEVEEVAVELGAATVVDVSLAPVLEAEIVAVVESVDDDPLGSIVTVHVFTSCTASLP